MPPLLEHALCLFKEGRYFDCHEWIEDHLWRGETDLERKRCYQAIIQWAVAQHHHRLGNGVGYERQRCKALAHVKHLPMEYVAWFDTFNM